MSAWGRATVVALLLTVVGAAQTPAAPAAPAAAASGGTKRIIFAGVAGAALGVLATTRLSFAGVAQSDRGARELRSGLTYATIGGLWAAAIEARRQAESAPPPHSFWWDRYNTPLWVGIAAVQTLDYTSTRYFRDRGKDEWLLTDSLVDHRTAFVATEIGAAGAGVSLSYLFHHAGHHRWERWVAVAYIGVGLTSAITNYRYPASGHDLFGN